MLQRAGTVIKPTVTLLKDGVMYIKTPPATSPDEAPDKNSKRMTLFTYRLEPQRSFFLGVFYSKSGVFPALYSVCCSANNRLNINENRHFHIIMPIGSGQGKTRAIREMMDNSGIDVLPIYLNAGHGDPGMTVTMAAFLESASTLVNRSTSRDDIHNLVHILVISHVVAYHCWVKAAAIKSRDIDKASQCIQACASYDNWPNFQLSPNGQALISDIFSAMTVTWLHNGQDAIRSLVGSIKRFRLLVFVDEFWSLFDTKKFAYTGDDENNVKVIVIPVTNDLRHTGDQHRDHMICHDFRGGLLMLPNVIYVITDTVSQMSYMETQADDDSYTAADACDVYYTFCLTVKPLTYDIALKYCSDIGYGDSDDMKKSVAFLSSGWWYNLGLLNPDACAPRDLNDFVDAAKNKMFVGTSFVSEQHIHRHVSDDDIAAYLILTHVLGIKGAAPRHLFEEIVQYRSGYVTELTCGQTINVVFGEKQQQIQWLTRNNLVNVQVISVGMSSSFIQARAVLEGVLTRENYINLVEDALFNMLLGPQAYQGFTTSCKSMLAECLPTIRLCIESYKRYKYYHYNVWCPTVVYDDQSDGELMSKLMSIKDLCVPFAYRMHNEQLNRQQLDVLYRHGIGLVRSSSKTPENVIWISKNGEHQWCSEMLDMK